MRVLDCTLRQEVYNDPHLLKDLEFRFLGCVVRLRVFPDYVGWLIQCGPLYRIGLTEYGLP